jgi:hypothetical protein
VEVYSVKSPQTFRQLFLIAAQQDRNNPLPHRSWGAPLTRDPLALKAPRRYEDRYCSAADERLSANLIPPSPTWRLRADIKMFRPSSARLPVFMSETQKHNRGCTEVH